MKIVSWNCNGSFRTKFKEIEKLNADIYVIQECENPKLTKSKEYKKFASNYFYVPHTKHKGLGIFAKNNIKIKNNNWKSYGLECYESLKINDKFDLIGVWACDNYIEDYFIYQEIYKDNFNENTIIIGDFNSNSLWDEKHNKRNHSDVVSNLNKIELESVYHCIFNENQGEETIATFYMHKNINKPYHIDYCFCNIELVNNFKILDIEWLKYSDHIPIVIEINDNKK